MAKLIDALRKALFQPTLHYAAGDGENCAAGEDERHKWFCAHCYIEWDARKGTPMCPWSTRRKGKAGERR